MLRFFANTTHKTSLHCSFSVLYRTAITKGAKETFYIKYRRIFYSSIAFNFEFMHNRACNLINVLFNRG